MDNLILDDRYEVLEQVGVGGMATVYRGRDRRLGGREVAIKMLHPHLAQRQDNRLRFQVEAENAANLEHDNILRVFDASGAGSDKSYIVMEFVRGRTLSDVVSEKPFRVPELGVMIAHEVTRAVVHAHRSRILHRDIKPENVMIRHDGVVKLMDFGIARALDVSHFTTTGALIGSPAHMAPEQIEGGPLDFKADVFSTGILLYFAVTGTLPFTAATPHALLRKILDTDYEPAQRVRPSVGRDVSRIIDKALRRAPEERYASADDLLSALASHLNLVGIANPGSELRSWAKNPKQYEDLLCQRIITRLHELADGAIHDGKPHVAIEYLNRVIALDNSDHRATSMLASLTESARWRRLGKRLVATIIIGTGVAFAVWRVIPDRKSPAQIQSVNEARTVASLRLERDGVAQTLNAVMRFPTVRIAESPEERQERRPEEMFQPVALVPVEIRVSPPAATLTVDGKVQRGGSPYRLRLGQGKHTAVLTHPSCDVCERTEYRFEIGPKSQPRTLNYAVAVKPAYLIVHTNTDARIFYGGTAQGRSGEKLKIVAKRPEPWAQEIRIEAPGYQSDTRQVRLGPGETSEVRVTLEKLSSAP